MGYQQSAEGLPLDKDNTMGYYDGMKTTQGRPAATGNEEGRMVTRENLIAWTVELVVTTLLMDRGKWTPGPWRVSTRANSDRLGICGLVDTVPVMIAGTWLRPTVGEEAANAALIAAAPALRAAIEELEKVRQNWRESVDRRRGNEGIDRWDDAMDQAIRAVVGEKPAKEDHAKVR